MKTKSHTATNPVSTEDITALNRINEILSQFQKKYDNEDVLMSPTDGEVVKIDELARVRGILSFFADNQTVDVNP